MMILYTTTFNEETFKLESELYTYVDTGDDITFFKQRKRFYDSGFLKNDRKIREVIRLIDFNKDYYKYRDTNREVLFCLFSRKDRNKKIREKLNKLLSVRFSVIVTFPKVLNEIRLLPGIGEEYHFAKERFDNIVAINFA